MSNIKFSVLMSVYKNDDIDCIKQAIDSILNQTLPANQIVIMVDGPITNAVYELLQEYENNILEIEIMYQSENRGLGITLNSGINICKYDYIARMDADDYSLPNRFEKQIKYLEKHPLIDVLGSNITEYDNSLNIILSQKTVPENDD